MLKKFTKADETRGPVTYYFPESKAKTGADMSRYSGVQDWRHKNTCPPFEFDALYRAFKWASRQRTGFSAAWYNLAAPLSQPVFRLPPWCIMQNPTTSVLPKDWSF
ncbi:MAG: hypothetical protein R3F53_14925 [Gammaproteobacteria bacterium]